MNGGTNKVDVALIGSIIAAVSVLAVGGVTWWTQTRIAENRVRWEASLETAKWETSRIDSLLSSFLDVGDAANVYMLVSADIDVTSWSQREKYVMAIVDSLGRARAEYYATRDFEGKDEVWASFESIEKFSGVHRSQKSLMDAWDPDLLARAVESISQARRASMIIPLKLHNDKSKRFIGRKKRTELGDGPSK
ncbi:hypothetical protein ACIRPH_27030 [Nocardiopsis sp. NPDC101807]|uniref:hypothetical protein n=1 Tax=Nocardiopsis sp. NPDC101807 TaxID=3364339 RepID=UPI0037F30BAA